MKYFVKKNKIVDDRGTRVFDIKLKNKSILSQRLQ